MPYFTYRQNNSGGKFTEPALYVIVEADNAAQADMRAAVVGLYFDGCAIGFDCSCCGDRWYRAHEGDATKRPEIWGQPISQYIKARKMSVADKMPWIIVVHADGSRDAYAYDGKKSKG